MESNPKLCQKTRALNSAPPCSRYRIRASFKDCTSTAPLSLLLLIVSLLVMSHLNSNRHSKLIYFPDILFITMLANFSGCFSSGCTVLVFTSLTMAERL